MASQENGHAMASLMNEWDLPAVLKSPPDQVIDLDPVESNFLAA